MFWTLWIAIGSLYCGLAVTLGALGSHWLKSKLDLSALASFEVGVRYQMYHGLAIILLGLITAKTESANLRLVGYLFSTGTLLFSGSIYALVLTPFRWLWPLTPIGGVALIIGWAFLCINSVQIYLKAQ